MSGTGSGAPESGAPAGGDAPEDGAAEPGRVLIVDDEDFVRESLRALLESRGYAVSTAAGGDEAAALLRREEVDVVLTDMRMPAGDGNRLLGVLRDARRDGELDVPVVVLSGASSVGEAVTAMKRGAFDLLEKPADPDRLVRALERAREQVRLRREVFALRDTLRPDDRRRWIAQAPASQRVRSALERAAASDAPLLLTGPSGVGKGVVAEEVHRASARAPEPFVRVDCAAHEPEQLAVLLYGARRGALGGDERRRLGRVSLARGGTLVLDEVDALEDALQARLMTLIESGEVTRVGDERARRADVRLIVSSNRDLRALSAEGRFRSDLYWRLDVLRLDVPGLEARREDLDELARALLEELSPVGAVPVLTPEALALLQSYGWPGNALELRSVLERARLLSQGLALDAETVGLALDGQLAAGTPGAGGGSRDDASGESLEIRANVAALERRLVLTALERARGKRSEAADLLGVDARNLGYYFRKHRLTDEELERAARGGAG